MKVEISYDIRGVGQVIGWEPLIIGVWCKWDKVIGHPDTICNEAQPGWH